MMNVATSASTAKKNVCSVTDQTEGINDAMIPVIAVPQLSSESAPCHSSAAYKKLHCCSNSLTIGSPSQSLWHGM
jgi:hypothetical protein